MVHVSVTLRGVFFTKDTCAPLEAYNSSVQVSILFFKSPHSSDQIPPVYLIVCCKKKKKKLYVMILGGGLTVLNFFLKGGFFIL